MSLPFAKPVAQRVDGERIVAPGKPVIVESVVAPLIFTVDLSVARTNARFDAAGDYLFALQATDAATAIDVRLDENSRDAIRMVLGTQIRLRGGLKFRRFFLTNAVQANKTLTLVVGNPEGVEVGIVGLTSITGIANPIRQNVISGPQTQNSVVNVGGVSTLLRTVPANTVELVQLRWVSGESADIWIAFGAAAVITTGGLMVVQEMREYVVSGGAAGLAINAILQSGSAAIGVLALPLS